ncbi:MAG: hypothetical protein COV31_00880 [Candidatus Yanofskybacteria bacterium CG10_big_fil_rev_8_21_14_0_10_46_23]|uniref:UDP-N-acetylmuramoyl-L-alanyl-D-glutamate--2, 6-diaminopimelate ligase n=1 Tax=Candidatus Yanofskybacteria bacterium CG10_big_fil_rev_8_21_14_0_10_46_23 TaxID=1975098 RepID=A0A2H0R4F6_9BACT|nr:MAG: hypothetical protein COV31_00880 [Candidatus Yanofskybacteria bacterium CG10_big_fil_rev_8_21_14_0_10_46_23]
MKEAGLEKILRLGRRLIPRQIFKFFQPGYHWLLAWFFAFRYGRPSNSMVVIGVTGTKGKSTVVYILTKILEEAGLAVGAVGSLGFKIRDKEWPNTLKMTMPGRGLIQALMRRARDQGVTHFILEVTSEGIAQKRHLGINFDVAVLTNIHPEHIESHGSFENYVSAKKKLFQKAKKVHVLNGDDKLIDEFTAIPAKKKIIYQAKDWSNLNLTTNLEGDFNKLNILAATRAAQELGVTLETIQSAITKVKRIPGRMDFVEKGQPFSIVIDYAHTPDSLRAVYRHLKGKLNEGQKLICVLGAAGGGRDTWKRPEFGKIADEYCDKIILTNEDPYDEDPHRIIEEVKRGVAVKTPQVIFDRRQAMRKAMTEAYKGDIVVITGKGSETSIALAQGQKVDWSDRRIAEELLEEIF